jgi:phosphoribosylanthranilate isomerase
VSTVRIKICGITSAEDALTAARLGADAIGLNFCPQSRRFVDFQRAATILEVLPPFVDPVGLFVNESLEAIGNQIQPLQRVRTIQWHGDNPELPRHPATFRYLPAFAIGTEVELDRVLAFLDRCRLAGSLPNAIVVDGHAPGQYGGTGQTIPWQLLMGFDPGVPVILAGGLTPGNVAEAIRIVRPYAVDVAGGVESAPGRKDAERIRRFIQAVRTADD